MKKGTKVIKICDGITDYLKLKGYVMLEDNWITEHNKILYDEKGESYKVLDFKEIDKHVLVNPTVMPHFDGWGYRKLSCIKLDKFVNVNTMLYTSPNNEKYILSQEDKLNTQNLPVINGNKINIEIYNCLNRLSNSVGETITEYHWREFCGLMKMMEDEKLIHINWEEDDTFTN